MSHYKDEAHERNQPTCPGCGQLPIETRTRYGLRNTCNDCDMWSWDRFPLVDRETHEARTAAHAVFDTLWKGANKVMKRHHAYGALRRELGLERDDCHMKLMSKETARKVPEASRRIRASEIALKMMGGSFQESTNGRKES